MSATLSAAARRELQNPAPVGQRHAQLVRLACSLLSAGFSTAERFHLLRANYDQATLPDAEILAVIAWAERTMPERFGRLVAPTKRLSQNLQKPPICGKSRSENRISSIGEIQRAINQFLNGFSFGEPDLFDASPIRLPNDSRKDPEVVFESLYSPNEKLNIVTQYREQKERNGKQKAIPFGFGTTRTRNEWIDSFRSDSIPQSQAGAWFRINPTNGNGITDEHVSFFRFVLMESDLIPPEIQISLFAKFPIPICAIVKSGGKSIHAWIRIAATNAGEYREKVSMLFSLLSPFGFDSSNKNPSRLSRLPGTQRTIWRERRWKTTPSLFESRRHRKKHRMNAQPVNLSILEKALTPPTVPPIVFLSPSEAKSYEPPAGAMLVGDCHIVRGSISVIGGAPGVGKRRAGRGGSERPAVVWFSGSPEIQNLNCSKREWPLPAQTGIF